MYANEQMLGWNTSLRYLPYNLREHTKSDFIPRICGIPCSHCSLSLGDSVQYALYCVD